MEQGVRGGTEVSWRGRHMQVWSWWTEYPWAEGEACKSMAVKCLSSKRQMANNLEMYPSSLTAFTFEGIFCCPFMYLITTYAIWLVSSTSWHYRTVSFWDRDSSSQNAHQFKTLLLWEKQTKLPATRTNFIREAGLLFLCWRLYSDR